MTTPLPSNHCKLAIDGIVEEHRRTMPDLQGVVEEQGPLVRQPADAARLSTVLHHAATELWDLCTYTSADEIKIEARAVANRIKAACVTR